jgi:hypothetical protein
VDRARGVYLALPVGLLAVGLMIPPQTLAGDGQPAAPQPQMVRFVSHFITFMPKDASILGDGGDVPKLFPRWMLPFLDPKAPAVVIPEEGPMVLKGLQELAPQLGPVDALSDRDPKAVVELLDRLDDRWDYHVCSLSGAGRTGDMMVASGRAGPISLETPQGLEIGPLDKEKFDLTCVVRVDRVPADGSALVQEVTVVDSGGRVFTSLGGGADEVRLGAATQRYGRSSGAGGRYTSTIGVEYPRVVRRGLVCLHTIDVGTWSASPPPGYY